MKSLSLYCLLNILYLANCNLQLYQKSPQEKNFQDPYLYFYIGTDFPITTSSLDVYDGNANLLKSLEANELIEELKISMESAFFLFVKLIKDNVYLLPIINNNKNPESEVTVHLIFIDDFLNVRYDLPDLQMSSKIKSSLFESLGAVNKHDAVITEDFKYAILAIKQEFEVFDIRTHFPDSIYENGLIQVNGLCVMDLKTGKEVSALPANGVFIELDHWWDYVSSYEIGLLYTSYEDFISISGDDTVAELPLANMNAMHLVDGSHFSSKYENEKLLLLNFKKQDAIYLLKWNFGDNYNTQENEYEIIWVLPSIAAPNGIKKQWFNKWEYLNDPFYGFSLSHDLNVFDLPKGHIIMFDNGWYHRASNVPGVSCPMSRALEYKIEMDVGGIEGFHRIELVFSYPAISDYPEFIYLENAPDTDLETCGEFWKIYNYQPIFGSCRKTVEGDYVFTYYPITLLNKDKEPSSPRMLKVNSDGDILNIWILKNNTGISYKIIPFSIKNI